MKIINKELTRKQFNAFEAKLSACNNRFDASFKKVKSKNLYTMNCKRCRATFLFSGNDIMCNNYEYQVKCPICGNQCNVSKEFVDKTCNDAKRVAGTNEKYVKKKAKLVAYAKKHHMNVDI